MRHPIHPMIPRIHRLRAAAGGGNLVGLILKTGNSHSIGRVSASGDTFNAKIKQWTQAGAIAAPAAAIFDDGDTSGNWEAGDLSPLLSMLNALVTDFPDLSEIVVVPNGQGSTGFSDGTWTPGGTRLPGAVSRWNAAKAAIEARGDTVVPICAVHLSANPDVAAVNAASDNIGAQLTYANNQDAYTDHLRANLSGVDSTFPVIIGCAMTNSELGGAGTNAPDGVSAGNGSAFRRAYTWHMDPINDWGDGETANLPVANFDGTHADRPGTLTEGRLLYAGYQRAITNPAPHAPFSGFATWSSCVSLYDFRSGCGRDHVGGYNLTQPTTNPPLLRWASAFGTFVFDRPSGTGRTFERPRYLPAQYTIVTRVSFDSLASAQGLLMNALGVSAVQQRFFINSSGNIVAGNAGGSQVSVAHGLSINTIYTLAATYDGTNIRVYRNGTLLATAAAPAPDQTQNLYLGAQGSASTGPLLGDMQWLAVYNRALDATELGELHSAEYNRPFLEPFSLDAGDFTVTERAEDANYRLLRDEVLIDPPTGYRFVTYRGQNSSGIATEGSYADMTQISPGLWRTDFAVRSPLGGSDYTNVLLVPTGAPANPPYNYPDLRLVSDVRRFIPSGQPYAPQFTYWADGSGGAQLRSITNAVVEGNGRDGASPWREVDLMRWNADGGATTEVPYAATLDLTGTGSQAIGLENHNVQGWGQQTVQTVHFDLPVPSEMSLTDAGDGESMIFGVVDPALLSGTALAGYEYSTDGGTTALPVNDGAIIPGSVGSNTIKVRAVYDVGYSAWSADVIGTIAGLGVEVFPVQVGDWLPISFRTPGATPSLGLPVEFTVGHTKVFACTIDGNGDVVSFTSGWDHVRSTPAGNDPHQHVFIKKHEAGDAPFSLTTDGNRAIRGAFGVFANVDDWEFTDPVSRYLSTSASIDIPSKTLAAGSRKARWVAMFGHSGSTNQQTAEISGFTGFFGGRTGTTSSDVGFQLCHLDYEGATLDIGAWPTVSRNCSSIGLILLGAQSASSPTPGGLTVTFDPAAPTDMQEVTVEFTFASGNTPITSSLTMGGVTTTNTTGIHIRNLPEGSYPYSYTTSNAAGAGPSGSGTFVVAAAPALTASVSLSPSSPTAGQTVTATVTVSPDGAIPGLTVLNQGASVALTPGVPGVWTFTAPATGTTTVTPTATLGEDFASGTDVTFTTGAVPAGVTYPQMWGVPEVGDQLTLVGGSGVTAPSYIIERTDNGGSTYATERTASPEDVFLVPNNVGRQYRAVMLQGTTRYAGDWTLPVVAAGPQMSVASGDGRTLTVQTTLATGIVRVRPYGGGTATTFAVSAATTDITLPDNGCWQIDYAADGVTYGSLGYRWCQTIGRGSAFGRNIAALHLFAERIIAILISGRQGTLDAITPVYNSYTEALVHAPDITVTFHEHGAIENFTAKLSYDEQGHTAFDNRYYTSSGGYKTALRPDTSKEARQAFDIANLVTRYPRMLKAGSQQTNHIKCVSRPDALLVGANEAHRAGLPDVLIGVQAQTDAPTSTQGPGQFVRHSSWSPGYTNYPQLEWLIDQFQARSFSTAGMGVTTTEADGLLLRAERFNPILGIQRGGAHPSDNHERLTVYKSSYPFDQGNYRFGRVHCRMAMLATSDFVDDDYKARAVKAMVYLGTDIDVPDKQAQVGAGISIHHELPIIMSRLARGVSWADLPTSQPGNNSGMIYQFQAGDEAKMLPHSNAAWPYFSRWSEVRGYVPASGGNYYLYVRKANADGSKLRMVGLNIIRQSVPGDLIPVITNDDSTSYVGVTCYRYTVSPAYFSTPPVVGEMICLQPPPDIAAQLVEGYCEWDFSGDSVLEPHLRASYIPTSKTSYRPNFHPYGLCWALRTTGTFPNVSPWIELETYAARTALPDYPGIGNWNHPWNEDGWPLLFWNAHAATLGISTGL